MVTTSVQSSNQGMKGGSSKKAKSPKRKAQGARSANKNASSHNSESMTSHLYRQGRDAVAGAYESAVKAGHYMPQLSSNLKSRRHSVYAMIEERPLVMGAVGLGVGMVLATLLPSISHHRNQR
jgi:hypothetical protein